MLILFRNRKCLYAFKQKHVQNVRGVLYIKIPNRNHDDELR